MWLGIDFGTSFIAAALCEGDRCRALDLDCDRTVIPTAAFVLPQARFLIGSDALVAGSEHPERLLLDIKHDLGAASYCSPVLVNGVLYLMTRDHLFAIKTGAQSKPVTTD